MPIIKVEGFNYYRLKEYGSDFLELYEDEGDDDDYPIELYDYENGESFHTEWHLGGPLYSLRLV